MTQNQSPFSSSVVFLRTLPLFSELRESTLAWLTTMCRFKITEKGEFLFFQGDPADFAYAIQSGKISISINSLDGRELVIDELQAGGFFGELGFLTGQPRSANAIAHTRSELLMLPHQAFLRLMDEEPKFVRCLLVMTAKRLQKSGEREIALAFKDAQARLAYLLLALDKAEEINGFITISQEELANRSGLIRQTVAKILGQWRRNGWLLTGRGKIVLLNHQALAHLGNEFPI